MKIAIFSISEFSGHRYAANAIEEEISLQYPDADVKNLNFFHYLPETFVKRVDDTYYAMLEKKPGLWTYLRESKFVSLLMKPLQILFYKMSRRRVAKEVFDDWTPDYVLCTQSYPCNVMAQLKKRYGFRLGAVLTDYHMNAYWVHSSVDDYFVASSDMKDDLSHMGVSSTRIHATGIPIRPLFRETAIRSEVLTSLGLKEDVLTILVMGGSLGMGSFDNLISKIVKANSEWQVILVCGSNQQLYEQMTHEYQENGRICVLGLTDQIAALMDSVHVLVSKPGGVTMAEALAKVLPIIMVNPLAGQEIRNQEYLVSNRVAMKAANMKDLISLLKKHEREWLLSPRLLSDLGYPNAVTDLVRSLTV